MLSKQTLATYKALGSKLKKLRQSKKLSIVKTAKSLQLPESTLKQLEKPTADTDLKPVYLDGLYIKYAKHLGIEESVKKQLGTVTEKKTAGKKRLNKPRRTLVLSSSAKRLSFLAVLSVLVGYVLLQTLAFFFSPSLTLNVGEERILVTEREFMLEGEVARSSVVLLNNSPLLLNKDGTFSQTLYLQPGINVFYITATNNLSRETVKKVEIVLKTD